MKDKSEVNRKSENFNNIENDNGWFEILNLPKDVLSTPKTRKIFLSKIEHST